MSPATSTAHARVYVIADERGRLLSEIASPHDRLTVATPGLAKQFPSAIAARTWLALADSIAPTARAPFEVQGLPAALLDPASPLSRPIG
jgi:hypothetical protein